MDKEEWLDNFQKEKWCWDFKNCYTESNEHSGICLFLNYKLGLLVDNSHQLKFTKIYSNEYICKEADCDKEAFPVYSFFNWQNSFKDGIRGETMNSFTTTFLRAIYLSENRDSVYDEIRINKNQYLKKQYAILLEEKNYGKFSIIKNNLEEFEAFAKLTHSIGNFTVLPNWMNTGRGGSFTICDYWDLTLKSLYDFLYPLDAWNNFVEKYYLQPFLNKDLKPVEFWDNHFNDSVNITDKNQVQQFLFRVNRSIAERGKFIKRKLSNISYDGYPKTSEELWTNKIKLVDLFSQE